MKEAKSYLYTVCIQCVTFNHKNYIADALNGFTIQNTSFPIVIVVIDDASPDNTKDVIKNYISNNFHKPSKIENLSEYDYIEAKHKQKANITIAAYFLKENHYSKRKSKYPYLKPWYEKSKYRALCEGDDWWTDSQKLQKQVDFMEKDPDTTLCFHNAIAHWEDGRKEDELFSNIENRFYNYDEVFLNFVVPTASILHRIDIIFTDLYKKVFSNPKLIVGDWPLLLVCAVLGKIRGMSDCMSVYRRTSTGFTLSVGSKTLTYNIKAADMNYEFYKIFPKPYNIPCRYKTIDYLIGAYSVAKNSGQKRYDLILEAFKRFPLYTPIYIFKYVGNRLLGKKRY